VQGTADRLKEIRDAAIAALEGMHAARELGLQASRRAIQLSSQAIRAAHRGEFDVARELVHEAGVALAQAGDKISGQPLIRYSGFMHDGEKEYAEAAVTVALVSGSRIPGPEDLGTSHPAFLNGLAEAASELRRSVLDAIRRADPSRADALLGLMDEAMGVVETMDFPEAVTSGLRRTTDALRSVVERTRGDVTAALRQQVLEERLRAIENGATQPERRR
jgi:translin